MIKTFVLLLFIKNYNAGGLVKIAEYRHQKDCIVAADVIRGEHGWAKSAPNFGVYCVKLLRPNSLSSLYEFPEEK